MLMLMAGVCKQFRTSFYEAARLDGRGTFATFRFVTLPMLMPGDRWRIDPARHRCAEDFFNSARTHWQEGVPVLSTYSYSLWDDAQKRTKRWLPR